MGKTVSWKMKNGLHFLNYDMLIWTLGLVSMKISDTLAPPWDDQFSVKVGGWRILRNWGILIMGGYFEMGVDIPLWTIHLLMVLLLNLSGGYICIQFTRKDNLIYLFLRIRVKLQLLLVGPIANRFKVRI